jgi:hypothetical protein
VAYSFAGTFTLSQFTRFKEYVLDQVHQIDARIEHLKAERDRIGTLAIAYDESGNPTHIANDHQVTYLGRLFGAYEALGGNVEFDLQVRSAAQPIFRIPGDSTKPAQLLSNGEVIGHQALGDAESSLTMQAMRRWVEQDLYRRRESLERKIRRAIDYSEQLTQEISDLTVLKGSEDTEGSLAYYINIIDSLTVDRNYVAITNDGGTDPHGRFAKAPIAKHTPGEKGATPRSYERTIDGLVKPAQ